MKRLSILVALVSIVSCQNQQPELFYLQDGIVKLKQDTTSVGSVGKLNGMRYKVVDNDMLKEWVMNNAQGKDKNLNVCTSKITNMSGIFDENPYDENGDLKQNMGISFNRDISNWDVSNVTDMSGMFSGASLFNQDIGNWDVSNVTDMSMMFNGRGSYNKPIFNQPIGDWDVSSVTTMDSMFSANLAFNQPIGNWDVSNVTDMSDMFSGAESFNKPIDNWDVSNVTSMDGIFKKSKFNKVPSSWDTSSVVTLEEKRKLEREEKRKLERTKPNPCAARDRSFIFTKIKQLGCDVVSIQNSGNRKYFVQYICWGSGRAVNDSQFFDYSNSPCN